MSGVDQTGSVSHCNAFCADVRLENALKQITLTDKGRLPDKEVYFCTYALKSGREIKVIVNGLDLREMKKKFNCDLEEVTSYALEQALVDGFKGHEIHLTGKIYHTVRKKLGEQ
jgi:hypothetical protein